MSSSVMPEMAERLSADLARWTAALSPEEVRREFLEHLLVLCRTLVAVHRENWEQLKASLEGGGREARDLIEQCVFLLREADANAEAFRNIRQLADARGFWPLDDSTQATKLAREMEAAETSRRAIVDLLAFAMQSPRPVEEARLAAAEEAFATDRFQKGTAVIDRLRSPRSAS